MAGIVGYILWDCCDIPSPQHRVCLLGGAGLRNQDFSCPTSLLYSDFLGKHQSDQLGQLGGLGHLLLRELGVKVEGG